MTASAGAVKLRDYVGRDPDLAPFARVEETVAEESHAVPVHLQGPQPHALVLWLTGIAATLVTAAIIGIASLSWTMNSTLQQLVVKVQTVDAKVTPVALTVQQNAGDIRELQRRVERIEDELQDHARNHRN